MLSHRNILFQARPMPISSPPLREGETSSSPSLPLCHIAERTFTVFNPLYTGSTVELRRVPSTRLPEKHPRKWAPALFFAVPRDLGESFYSGGGPAHAARATWARPRRLRAGASGSGQARPRKRRPSPGRPVPWGPSAGLPGGRLPGARQRQALDRACTGARRGRHRRGPPSPPS